MFLGWKYVENEQGHAVLKKYEMYRVTGLQQDIQLRNSTLYGVFSSKNSWIMGSFGTVASDGVVTRPPILVSVFTSWNSCGEKHTAKIEVRFISPDSVTAQIVPATNFGVAVWRKC